jgi:hypothetical protein
MALKIELGKKYSAGEADTIVDQLYSKVRDRWETKVNQTPFMQQLMAGKLPLKTLQTFFRNWGAYTIEINTLTACTYHRNITFLKVNRDLMGPIGERSPTSSFTRNRRAIFWSCCKPPTLSASPRTRFLRRRCFQSFVLKSISCAASSTKGRRRSGTPP